MTNIVRFLKINGLHIDADYLIHAGLAEYADFYDEDGNLYE